MSDALHRELGPLADPNEFHDSIDVRGCETSVLLRWLESMLRVRIVEEAVGEMVGTGEVNCPCHLAIGQEACAVGVIEALEQGDVVFGAHRSHGHYLALGGTPERLLSEILGRDTGCSRGLGGSMHLHEPSLGLLGTVPIVGATIPIAVGAALAARMDGRGRVAVSFFGDGAAEEGVFHESLNLASAHNLPVLFVCENNLFSSHLHISERQPSDSITRFAEAHGLDTRVVDGNDVVAVHRATTELLAGVRKGRAGFLEAVTYRWRGHVGHREDIDVGVGRGTGLHLWKERDPIRRLVDALTAAGEFDTVALGELRQRIVVEVTQALTAARQAPYPPPELLLDAVYRGGH
jgi:pyruvate dehydrogenase E1 component alpha subunit